LMTEFFLKSLPLTVSVNDESPEVADVGLIVWSVGAGFLTVKPPANATGVSAPVITLTFLAPAGALEETVMFTVAWLASFVVVEFTVIPVPEKLATLIPLEKAVLIPVIAKFRFP
jgi:hypothetical protein